PPYAGGVARHLQRPEQPAAAGNQGLLAELRSSGILSARHAGMDAIESRDAVRDGIRCGDDVREEPRGEPLVSFGDPPEGCTPDRGPCKIQAKYKDCWDRNHQSRLFRGGARIDLFTSGRRRPIKKPAGRASIRKNPRLGFQPSPILSAKASER